MKALKVAAAALILVLATYVIYGMAWRPYQCNIVKNRVQTMALTLIGVADESTVAINARRGIAEMQPCLEALPTDADAYMTIALVDRSAGRLQDAADMYRKALLYDRRPELYYNLGTVQLQMNERAAATESFTKACSFDFYVVTMIGDQRIYDSVIAAVRAQQSRAGHSRK